VRLGLGSRGFGRWYGGAPVPVLAFALAAVLALGACEGKEAPNVASEETSGAQREIRGFELTETHEGRRSWVLHAETAWRFANLDEVKLKNPKLEFYDDQGRVSSVLTARNGTVDEKSGNMTAREAVHLVTTDGDTLETVEMNYSRDDDRITGPGPVRIRKPDRVLTGVGFEAKPDLSEYQVKKDVHVTIIDRERNVDTGS
jgi:LPS export ABC transporter protein LptC